MLDTQHIIPKQVFLMETVLFSWLNFPEQIWQWQLVGYIILLCNRYNRVDRFYFTIIITNLSLSKWYTCNSITVRGNEIKQGSECVISITSSGITSLFQTLASSLGTQKHLSSLTEPHSCHKHLSLTNLWQIWSIIHFLNILSDPASLKNLKTGNKWSII